MALAWRLALGAGLFVLSGCAPLEARPATVVAERVVRTEPVEAPVEGVAATIATPAEGELVVEARRACETRERQTIERDLEVRYETKARWMDVALVSSGLALTSAGIITLVDSGKVAPGHTSGPDYNPVGRGAAVAIGSGLVIGGVALGTIAAIDFFRMGRVTRRTETVSRERHREGAKVACRTGVVDDAYVELRIGRVAYGAGSTDANGHLATTLDAVFGRELVLPLRESAAKVVVAGRVEGEVDLRSFAARREDEAWRRVNLQQCAEALGLDACAPVEAHLRIYPDGPHADDARRALSRAEPQLARLRDQAAWHRVQGSLVTCSGRDGAEAAAIEVACGVLGGYLRDFPRGERAREAESAVAAGRARASALRAAAGKNEKDRCVGTCRAHCATASVAHFDDCFKGCIEGRCGK